MGGWGGDPAVQVHRKDGRPCLRMPRDTMFSEEQQEQRRGRRAWGVEGKRTEEEEEEGKKEESGGHMSPSLLSACLLPDFMLNIDAGAENKPCPNTGVGWQTGVDRAPTPDGTFSNSLPPSSLSIQLRGQTSTLTSGPDSKLPAPASQRSLQQIYCCGEGIQIHHSVPSHMLPLVHFSAVHQT